MIRYEIERGDVKCLDKKTDMEWSGKLDKIVRKNSM